MVDREESEQIIKFKYESGVYSLKYVFILAEMNLITKDQFRYITGYDYEGLNYYVRLDYDKKKNIFYYCQ